MAKNKGGAAVAAPPKVDRAKHSADYEAARAACSKSIAESRTFSRWAPPAGTYTMLITKVGKAEPKKKKDQKTNKTLWTFSQAIEMKLLDGDDAGRGFTFFGRAREGTQMSGEWKGLAAVLTGEQQDDVVDLEAACLGGVGKSVVVDVSKSDKYTNYDFLRLAEGSGSTVEEAAPDTDDDDDDDDDDAEDQDDDSDSDADDDDDED